MKIRELNWISVKKYLPPQSKGYHTSKWVLVTVKTNKDTKFTCMGRYSYETNCWDIANYEYGVIPIYHKDTCEVTAWADVKPFEDFENLEYKENSNIGKELSPAVVWYMIPVIKDDKVYTQRIPIKEYDNQDSAIFAATYSPLSCAGAIGWSYKEEFDKIYRDKLIELG